MPVEMRRGSQPHDSENSEQDGDPIAALPPTDKGPEAWKYLLGYFILEAVLWGFSLSFGVFQDYYPRQPEFRDDAGQIAIIGTVATSIYFLGAPIAAPLVKVLQAWQRVMVVSGSVVCILAIMLASFVSYVPGLIGTQGAILAVHSDYAFSICSQTAASSDALLEHQAHRPPVLQEPHLLGLFTFQPLSGVGVLHPSLYLSTFASSLGLSSTLGALVLALNNTATILGQIGFGYLTDRYPNIFIVIFASSFVAAISAFAIWGFADSVERLIVFSLFYGFFAGGFPNCRSKHLKCDDAQPSCSRCSRTGAKCVREYVRFKGQVNPQPAPAEMEEVQSNQYKFPAHQTWCALDKAIQFVDETGEQQSKEPASEDDRLSTPAGDGVLKHATQQVGLEKRHQDISTQAESHASSSTSAAHSIFHQLNPSPEATWHHDSTSDSHQIPEVPLPLESEPHNRLLELPVTDLHDTASNVPVSVESPHNVEGAAITSTPSEDYGLVQGTSPVFPSFYQGVSVWPLQDPVEIKLMRYYIENVSRRFDLCDPQRHFALVVPWRASRCSPLLDAAFALSARCLSRTTDFDSYISSRYYDRCLSSLIPTLANPNSLKNQDLFAAIVLLRTLEEIEVPLSGADSSTHLFGSQLFASASTVDSHSSPGIREPSSLTGLRRASFLVAFRQEIYMAFVSQRPVLPAFCPHDRDQSLDDSADDCTWTNKILLHLVDTLSFCYAGDPMYPDQAIRIYNNLTEYADQWYAKKPPSFDPISYEEECIGTGEAHNSTRNFATKVWILSDAAATGLLNYHLLRILLLSFNPHAPRVGPSRARFVKQQDQDIKHQVKTLVGLANGNAECAPHFVLACMGIAMAGDRFEERWEQEELMRFLKRTENLHAWSTISAQRHLVEAWNWSEADG